MFCANRRRQHGDHMERRLQWTPVHYFSGYEVKQLFVDYTNLRRFTKKYKKQKKRIFGNRIGLKIFRLGLKKFRFKGLRFSD